MPDVIFSPSDVKDAFPPGEEREGLSGSRQHSAVCPERPDEHSLQPSRGCESHLRRQAAQGFASRSADFTRLRLTPWPTEVFKTCSEFAADGLCPGGRVESQRESAHG